MLALHMEMISFLLEGTSGSGDEQCTRNNLRATTHGTLTLTSAVTAMQLLAYT